MFALKSFDLGRTLIKSTSLPKADTIYGGKNIDDDKTNPLIALQDKNLKDF